MAVFFTRRGSKEAKPVLVAITGTGNATYCYATINGTKYSAATSNIEVLPDDVITFGVYGSSNVAYGEVKINGSQVLEVTDSLTQTYEWTVPGGLSEITIFLQYKGTGDRRTGRISVTTA